MALGVIAAAVVVVIATVVLYFKWSFNFWKDRNVFTLPTEIPYGNGRNLVKAKTAIGMEMYRMYKELRSRNLRYGGYYSLTRPFFIPVDITLIRNILTTDFQYFTDHTDFVNEKHDPLSGHLFAQAGAKWKALRIKLTPTFTTGKMKMMFQTLVNCTNGLEALLAEAVKDQETLDIKETFARYTTDIIASVAFGIECNCLQNPNAEFRMYGKKIFEVSRMMRFKRIINALAPKLFKQLGFSLNSREVERFFLNLVRETAEYRDKNNYERRDFMQLLLDLRNTPLKIESRTHDGDENNGKLNYYQNGLTLNEIAAQAFVFFLAGYETSSTTLNFLMYELTVNLEIQEKLRKEILDVLKRHNNEITYEAINEMTYLDKCISETLRKYPPLPALPRLCTKTYQIPNSNATVPIGAMTFISTYGIHHDPEFYPDPEKFDPERFSEEKKKERPPMTFLAFGEGPRICIGLRLGVLQTKVGLVSMLRKFKFILNSKTKVPLTFEPLQFILTASGGIWVDVHSI